MPRRDGRDLARRLLRRADGDITLVRTVVDNEEIRDAIVGFHAQQAVENPWAVEFRYEEDDEPPTDRRATLAFIEEIRRWAGEAVER